MFSKAKILYINSLERKKNRDSYGVFIVEGEKLSEEVIKCGYTIEEIFYTSKLSERINLDLLNCEKSEVSHDKMARISQLKSVSTILMVVKKPISKITKIDNAKLTLVLDGVQDPGNMGTIIRVADWFGVKNIFCSLESVDVFNPKVVQATMGAIARVNVTYCNIEELLKTTTIPIYGTFLDGESIYSKTLSKEGVIVMGNEGNGISKEIEELITTKLLIPSYSPSEECVESLNVGIATAITLSEFRRNFIK